MIAFFKENKWINILSLSKMIPFLTFIGMSEGPEDLSEKHDE